MHVYTHSIYYNEVSKNTTFLDPEGWSQNATLVVLVLVLVGISSLTGLKIPQAFLIHSAAQRNFAYTFVLLIFPAYLPSQIFTFLN